MKIFNFEITKAKKEVSVTPAPQFTPYVSTIKASAQMPKISEKQNIDWVSYGEDNLYPQRLLEFYNISPLHKSIVNTKAKFMSGENFYFGGATTAEESAAFLNAMPMPQRIELERLVKNPNDEGDTLRDIVERVSMDWQLHGMFAMEVIWSFDMSKIAELRHVDISTVRVGKADDEGRQSRYYITRDWSQARRPGFFPTMVPTFTEEGGAYSQLIFVRQHIPGMCHYSPPEYTSALEWIEADGALGTFHKSHVLNGFSPKTIISFPRTPGTDEEKEAIDRVLKTKFTGPDGNRLIATYGDGEGNYTNVSSIQSSNAADEFNATSEQIVNQIIFAHSIPNPAIVGLAMPGKLGYTGGEDIKESYRKFYTLTIAPAQARVERVLNRIFSVNGVDAGLRLDNILANATAQAQDGNLPKANG